MEFRVRPADISDLEVLVEFTRAEALDAEGCQIERDTARKGVARGLQDPTVATYWVIESDQREIVGSASAVREWSDWRATDYWWIQSMYILPEFRRRSLASLLLNAIAEAAWEAGAAELRLYVHQANKAAIGAYRRHGFATSPYDIMTRDLSGRTTR
jgi:ribosomal protein S18 acetylase RimI-like enzyme